MGFGGFGDWGFLGLILWGSARKISGVGIVGIEVGWGCFGGSGFLVLIFGLKISGVGDFWN